MEVQATGETAATMPVGCAAIIVALAAVFVVALTVVLEAAEEPRRRPLLRDPVAAAPPSPVDLDCAHFVRWIEAQIAFRAAGGPALDPHGLDGDRNGLACDHLP